MYHIKGNKIVYSNHCVVLDIELHKVMPTYVNEMAVDLSANGSAEQHEKELRKMNNDGSWVVTSL